MKNAACLILLALCTFLSACTTVQSGSAFQAGRRALIGGDDEAVLGFFQTVAADDHGAVMRLIDSQQVLRQLFTNLFAASADGRVLVTADKRQV